MIYIGLVIAFMLMGISAIKVKKDSTKEESLLGGLKGTSFQLSSDLSPQPQFSGLGNSVCLAGRIWSVDVKKAMPAGSWVKVTNVCGGVILVDFVDNVTVLNQAA